MFGYIFSLSAGINGDEGYIYLCETYLPMTIFIAAWICITTNITLAFLLIVFTLIVSRKLTRLYGDTFKSEVTKMNVVMFTVSLTYCVRSAVEITCLTFAWTQRFQYLCRFVVNLLTLTVPLLLISAPIFMIYSIHLQRAWQERITAGPEFAQEQAYISVSSSSTDDSEDADLINLLASPEDRFKTLEG